MIAVADAALDLVPKDGVEMFFFILMSFVVAGAIGPRARVAARRRLR